MANYTFKTPTVDEGPAGFGPLFSKFKLTRGISIVNTAGVYTQVRDISADDMPNYVAYYQGGGTFTVDDTIRTAMIAANIGISATNFTAQ